MNNAVKVLHPLISSDLKKRIEAITSLPTLPETYKQLVIELDSAEVSMKRVSTIVSQDIAIAARVLKAVNSAFFGLSKEIQGIQQAVNYLGVDTVKGIVLSAGVFSGERISESSGFSPSMLYRRGAAVGPKSRFIAYSFGLHRIQVDDALTAGFLHDIGKLVLLVGFTKELAEACGYSKKEDIPLHEAIEKVLGANDAMIGGYLLESWGLSESIVQAVALHYKPSLCANPELNATAAVHLAFASEFNHEHHPDDPEKAAFDLDYTEVLGITNQLSQFKGLSSEALSINN